MARVSTRTEKPLTTRSRGLTAQNKKDLECILGLCKHSAFTNTKCLYWDKVVDAADPAQEQYKLIVKLIGGIK